MATPVLSTLLERTAAHEEPGNRHVLFPAGVVTLVFGEVKFVHLIRDTESCLSPDGRPTTGSSKSKSR